MSTLSVIQIPVPLDFKIIQKCNVISALKNDEIIIITLFPYCNYELVFFLAEGYLNTSKHLNDEY